MSDVRPQAKAAAEALANLSLADAALGVLERLENPRNAARVRRIERALTALRQEELGAYDEAMLRCKLVPR